jgi:hypothetical protein
MRLSIWRPKLLTWLGQKVNVDSWGIQVPETVGQTTGYLPPLKDIHHDLDSPLSVIGSAVQDIYILQRHSRDTKYIDLPLGELEGLYSTLAIRLVHDWEMIIPETSLEPGTQGLIKLELNSLDAPISLEESGDGLGEWLVRLHWQLAIQWVADPELGAVVEPYQPQSIGINIRRTWLTGMTSVLDFTLKTS